MKKLGLIVGFLVGWWVLAPLFFHKPIGGDWTDVVASLVVAGALWFILLRMDKHETQSNTNGVGKSVSD